MKITPCFAHALLVDAPGLTFHFNMAQIWKVAELSHGMLKSLPCDSNGAAIPETALESTFATGLPVETELLVQYLARQR